MVHAVDYARISDKKQEEGFSVPAQLKLLKDYAQKEGFKIVKEFKDIETAKKAGRTNFDNMIKFLQDNPRSEEHTSELQSHSFISYAVFCLKKKNKK